MTDFPVGKPLTKITLVVLALVFMVSGRSASGQATSPCSEVEAQILSHVVGVVEGRNAPDELSAILGRVGPCLERGSLSPYQQFAITYVTAYGHYVLGIAQRSGRELNKARALFQRAATLYREEFDQPRKRWFCDLMQAWCDWRRFELSPSANRASLDNCVRFLSTGPELGNLADDAKLLLAMALMRKAEMETANGSTSDAYQDLREAINTLHGVRAHPSMKDLLSVAILKAIQTAFTLRLAGEEEAPSDEELERLLELVGEGPGPCAANAGCLRCLMGLNFDTGRGIERARNRWGFPVPKERCENACADGALESMRAILALQLPQPGNNTVWSHFARLFHYWRGRVSGIGAGGGILPLGLFGQAVAQDSALSTLINYGRLVVSIINCGTVGDPGELPRLPLLHASELSGQGGDPLARGIWYLALAPLSNGCLYGLAASAFNEMPTPSEPNSACELAILKAYALAKGGLGGGDYASALALLNAVDEGALDTPHRVELYLAKGLVSQAMNGWIGPTVDYLDRYDEIDPRAAYFLHYVRSPGSPDIGPLRRALHQTEQLIAKGYALGWLLDRLRAIPGITPDSSGPDAQLLPDDPPRRWDILRPDLSEASIARQLYLDVLEALTLYVGAYLPVPSVPRPSWEFPPKGDIQGPREIFLQSEIPVALELEGTSWPAHVWVLQGDQLVDEIESYKGQEIELLSGVRYQIMVQAQGHWPAYLDTFFVQPHETLLVHLVPAMRLGAAKPFGVERDQSRMSVWNAGGVELTYDPDQHAYELTGSSSATHKQMEGEPFVHLTKFVHGSGDEIWLLDVGNNRLLRRESREATAFRVGVELDSLGVRRAVDVSRVSGGFVLADAGARRLVQMDLNFSAVTWASDTLEWTPTAVLGLPRYGDLVWVADAYGGTLWTLRDGDFRSVAGLEAAIQDGLTAPARLLWLDGLNYVCVTDYFTRGLFLFLPNGEYVGFLRLNAGIGPLFWVRYADEGNPTLLTSDTGGRFAHELLPIGGYQFTLNGEYAPAGRSEQRLQYSYLRCQ